MAEHESEEEESKGDYSESLLDDGSPTTSSVQLNAVTALLASDELQQPNPVVPYPSDVQVHSSTHVISAANRHLEGCRGYILSLALTSGGVGSESS